MISFDHTYFTRLGFVISELRCEEDDERVGEFFDEYEKVRADPNTDDVMALAGKYDIDPSAIQRLTEELDDIENHIIFDRGLKGPEGEKSEGYENFWD